MRKSSLVDFFLAQHAPQSGRAPAFARRARLQRGFSLLEILIVLAIVGILASMAIPRYQSFVVQREVDTVARELAQSVEMARIRAQSFGQNIQVCPVDIAQLNQALPRCNAALSAVAPWQAWVVLELNAAGSTSQVIQRSAQIPASVSVSGNAFNGRVFNALGQPNTVGFTITVTASQPNVLPSIQAQQVVLADSGRVRMP